MNQVLLRSMTRTKVTPYEIAAKKRLYTLKLPGEQVKVRQVLRTILVIIASLSDEDQLSKRAEISFCNLIRQKINAWPEDLPLSF